MKKALWIIGGLSIIACSIITLVLRLDFAFTYFEAVTFIITVGTSIMLGCTFIAFAFMPNKEKKQKPIKDDGKRAFQKSLYE